MGFGRIASRPLVYALALVELAVGIAGLMASLLGPLAVVPMVVTLSAFSVVLLVKRPEQCGCGMFDLGWRPGVIRNTILVMLLFASVVALQ